MASGETFVKIAWNPEFLSAPLAKTTPKYGLKIECPGGGCNGLPCSIDPSKGGVGSLDSPVATNGVGDAAFCVVTVPKGKTAHIVVFNTDGSSSGGGDDPAPSSKPAPAPTKATTVEKPTNDPQTSTTAQATTAAEASTVSSAPASETSQPFVGGIFYEQDGQGDVSSYAAEPSTTSKPVAADPQGQDPAAPVETTTKNGGVGVPAERGSAIAGLVVALVAAAALF